MQGETPQPGPNPGSATIRKQDFRVIFPDLFQFIITQICYNSHYDPALSIGADL